MPETLNFNEKPSSPAKLAAFLHRKRQQALGNLAVPSVEQRDEDTGVDKVKDDIQVPRTGAEYTDEYDNKLFFVPAYKNVRNPATGSYDRKPYTLRDYFSHTAADGTNGPGWDMRWGLKDLTEEQMLERYGHVFTDDEIRSPGGTRSESYELEGGMPDNIIYYDLVDQQEYNELVKRGLV